MLSCSLAKRLLTKLEFSDYLITLCQLMKFCNYYYYSDKPAPILVRSLNCSTSPITFVFKISQ